MRAVVQLSIEGGSGDRLAETWSSTDYDSESTR